MPRDRLSKTKINNLIAKRDKLIASGEKLTREIRKGIIGLHSDDNNLYLKITRGSASWVFRYKERGTKHINKKGKMISVVRTPGFGPYPLVSLEEARDLAIKNRKLLLAKEDPKKVRDQQTFEKLAALGKAQTVRQAVESYRQLKIENTKANTRSGANRYLNMLNRALGDMLIERVTREIFLNAKLQLGSRPDDTTNLVALWADMFPTAQAYQTRCSHFFEWAIDVGSFTHPNPAVFYRLKNFLPEVNYKEKHRKEPDFRDMPRIMAKLWHCRWGGMFGSYEGIPPLALGLMLIALTGVRPSEVRLAEWGEFDRQRKVWTIPVEHQKDPPDNEPKEIPITTAMEMVLDEAAKIAYPTTQALSHSPRSTQKRPRIFPQARHVPDTSHNALVFPNSIEKPFNEAEFPRFVRETLKETSWNPHGLRGAVKNWSRRHAPYPHLWEILWKIQAGHSIGSKGSDKPYGREKLLDERRQTYELWGKFVFSQITPEPKLTPEQKVGDLLHIDKKRRSA
jgi:integrase